jgi:hypothetical protein
MRAVSAYPTRFILEAVAARFRLTNGSFKVLVKDGYVTGVENEFIAFIRDHPTLGNTMDDPVVWGGFSETLEKETDG